jgi:hypothetical protein
MRAARFPSRAATVPTWALLAALGAALPVAAQPRDPPPFALTSLTVYGGWRTGGGFTDTSTGAAVSTDASAALAASLELPLDANRQIQVFVSHQSSQLALATGARLPIDVTHLHLGGTNYFEGPVGRGPYLSGGLGVSVFSPGLSGLSTELRPSLSIGVGWQVPLAPRVSLRLEARGHVALVNSDGGFFCSGGCVVSIRGDTYTQGELLVGLSVGF